MAEKGSQKVEVRKRRKMSVIGRSTFEDLTKTIDKHTNLEDVAGDALATGDPQIIHPYMEGDRANRVIKRTIPSGSGGSQAQQESPGQK